MFKIGADSGSNMVEYEFSNVQDFKYLAPW